MGIQMALLASEVSLFDMNSWWWAICKGMYWVINAIEEAYGYLVGIKTVSTGADSASGGAEISDILFLNITDSRVQKAFLIFFIVAAALLLIFLGIGMIKASFQNDDQLASRGKMVGKAFQAFLIMLLLPLIMYIGVVACGAFIRLISATMQYSLNTSGQSIAENIHQTCLPVGTKNASKIHWYTSYDDLKRQGINNEYQYVLAMLASGILIYVLIAICTSLVERLIEVVFFYLIGPFVLARAPLDDGGSFKLWKDGVIAKMLSAAGVIISMYLYFVLMQNINSWFAPQSSDGDSTVIAKGMVKIMFCIGGAFAAKKGALSIAQIISQNTGVSEGMAQGQSMHMLSSGLNLGMSAIRGGLMGMSLARQTGGTAANSGATALSAMTSGTGRANIPTETGDMFSQAGSGSAGAAASGGAGGVLGATAQKSPVIDNSAAASRSQVGGQDALGADGNNLLNNPNLGGEIGRMNTAKKAGGGLGTAFLYGGGLLGGVMSAGAYLGGKAIDKVARPVIGMVTKPIKALGNKVSNSIKNSGRRRGWEQARIEKRAAQMEKKAEDGIIKTQANKDKLNKNLDKSITAYQKKAQKIDEKYGDTLSQDSIANIKAAQFAPQLAKMEKKIQRLTNAGVADENILAKYIDLSGKDYSNKTNSNNIKGAES